MLHELVPAQEVLIAHITPIFSFLLVLSSASLLRSPSLFPGLFFIILTRTSWSLCILLLDWLFCLLCIFVISSSAALFATSFFLPFLVTAIVAIPIEVLLIQLKYRSSLFILLLFL